MPFGCCRCHYVVLWSYLCFVLLLFRPYALVEYEALRSIIFRYAGAPIATRVSFFFALVVLEMLLFTSIFCTIAVFSFCGEFVARSFLPDDVFFFVTTGWIFDMSLCENSSNQSINSINRWIHGHTYKKCMDQPGKVGNPACGQLALGLLRETVTLVAQSISHKHSFHQKL